MLFMEGYGDSGTTEWYLRRGMVTQLQLNGINLDNINNTKVARVLSSMMFLIQNETSK